MFRPPGNIDPEVSSFVKYSVDTGFKAGFYCSKRYGKSGDECDRDRLCSSLGKKCGVSPHHIRQIAKDALEVSYNAGLLRYIKFCYWQGLKYWYDSLDHL